MRLLGGLLLLIVAPATAQQSELPPLSYPDLPRTAARVGDFVAPGWIAASKAEGDLNRDGRRDIVLALWPEWAAKATAYEERHSIPSYRLVIGFAEPDGGYRLVADNKTLIEPPGYSGAYEDPLDGDSLRVVRGSLDISRDLLRGHYRYRFRWSDEAFRLIGYEYAGSDGSCITMSSFNFLTRRAEIEVMPISEDWRRKVIRPIKRRTLATLDAANAEDFHTNLDVIGDWPACPRSD